MSPIGLAVIGAGYWGPNLVRTALATPALQLEWLCDLDEERAQAVLGRYTTVQGHRLVRRGARRPGGRRRRDRDASRHPLRPCARPPSRRASTCWWRSR